MDISELRIGDRVLMANGEIMSTERISIADKLVAMRGKEGIGYCAFVSSWSVVERNIIEYATDAAGQSVMLDMRIAQAKEIPLEWPVTVYWRDGATTVYNLGGSIWLDEPDSADRLRYLFQSINSSENYRYVARISYLDLRNLGFEGKILVSQPIDVSTGVLVGFDDDDSAAVLRCMGYDLWVNEPKSP